MRIIAALVLAVVAWWGGGFARAADLAGVWGLDQPAWEQQVDRIVQSMLSRIPPEAMAQMKAQGIDPSLMIKRTVAKSLDSTIEFLPAGIVRTTSVDDGSSDDGRWTLSGDELRIEVADADKLEAMVGKVEGDRMTLHPILAGNDPDLAFMRELVYPLVRHR